MTKTNRTRPFPWGVTHKVPLAKTADCSTHPSPRNKCSPFKEKVPTGTGDVKEKKKNKKIYLL